MMTEDRGEALALLRLMAEWGADEAILPAPVCRLASPSATTASEPAVPVPLRPATAAVNAAAPSGTPAFRAASLAAASGDVATLAAGIASAGLLSIAGTAAHCLLGDGPLDASLMLIADAPDDDDDRAGRAFAGGAGALLDQMLGSISIARDQVRVGFLSPWRPPGGRPLNDTEIGACLPILRRHISLIAPARLLLIGPLAARALLGRETARRRNSSPAWTGIAADEGAPPVPALLLPDLTAVRSRAAARRSAWAALRLLRRTMDGAKPLTHPGD
jgi:uracil-DNA glycosylase family 4